MTVIPIIHDVNHEIAKTLSFDNCLAVGTSDGEILILEVLKSIVNCKKFFPAHKDAILEFEKSEDIIVSLALDKKLKIWSHDWTLISEISLPNFITRLAIAPFTGAIAAINNNSTICIWTKEGKLAHVCQTDKTFFNLVWKPSGDILVIVGDNFDLCIFDFLGSSVINPFFT